LVGSWFSVGHRPKADDPGKRLSDPGSASRTVEELHHADRQWAAQGTQKKAAILFDELFLALYKYTVG
jgi:hypothetical protein